MKKKIILARISFLSMTIAFSNLGNVNVFASEVGSALIPQSQMKITASSEHPNIGTEGLATFAIDGNERTIWHTKWSGVPDKVPQSLTLDLGGSYVINKFTYLPRQDGANNGTITKYQIQVSTDGIEFKTVKTGSLRSDAILKVINFEDVQATHVRFVVLEGVNNLGSAAEINVYKSVKQEDEEIGSLKISGKDSVKIQEDISLSLGLYEMAKEISLFGGTLKVNFDSEIFDLVKVESLKEEIMVDGISKKNGEVEILIASLDGSDLPLNEDFINIVLKSKKVSEKSDISLGFGEFGDSKGNLYNVKMQEKSIKVYDEEAGSVLNKVTNLKALEVDKESIKLSWNYENTLDNKEFIIYKDGKEISKTKDLSYKINDLKSNTIYGFKVVVVDNNGYKSKPVSINIRTAK
ncbi:discoidin domain-containing protein [Clostridium sp.]|uniref:discoidin domain-containing protein n=1 Tax=Clostridium sp. TaxID=1506 RepID=UPI003F320963